MLVKGLAAAAPPVAVEVSAVASLDLAAIIVKSYGKGIIRNARDEA